ncbi:unnamed protein product [Arabidopsis halleri]
MTHSKKKVIRVLDTFSSVYIYIAKHIRFYSHDGKTRT